MMAISNPTGGLHMPRTREMITIEGDTTSPLVVKLYDDGCLMLIQGDDYVHLTVAQLRAVVALEEGSHANQG
jgi:Leu/Phe-tRNA-protein transferase